MTSRPYVETVVFVGGISADMRSWVHEHPDADNDVAWGSEGRLSPGGRAASAAVGAVKLGRRFVDLVGCVGDDLLGESIVTSLKDAGVSVRLVDKVDGVATGMQQVVIDTKGERRSVGVSNANWQCGPAQIRRAESTILGADLLYTTLEVPLPTVERVIMSAAQRRVPVLFDATPFPTPAGIEVIDQLKHVDVLLANWSAARRLGDMPTASGPVAVELAERLLRLGPRAVVITMGEHGAMLATRGRHALVPAHSVRVVDLSGAGDAFAAGLVVALTDQSRGNWRWGQLLHATRFAMAASSVSVMGHGYHEALPKREEVERLMAMGTR